MKKFLSILFIVLLIAASDAAAIWLYKKQTQKPPEDYNTKISILQKEIFDLQNQLADVSKQSSAAALSAAELANRQVVHQQSQDELLTAAVAKVVPSVVSIVISKDIPQLQITYVNPFGNDPLFKDFGYKVPVYQPTGQTKREQIGAGTGFIIAADGYILTNRHVVADDQANYTVLLSNGKQENARVIYKDPQNDMAIIKISGNNYPSANFGDSNSLKLGQTVIAIGNALGQYNNSVSVGIISGLNRTISAYDENGGSETLNGVIQTDAAINPGNSGGPLLDLNGNVNGINVATVQGSNSISFSIPIKTVRSIIKNVIGR